MGQVGLNILENDREASDSMRSISQCWAIIELENALIRDIIELARGIRELLSDLVGKLDCRDEVADAEAEAHL